MMAFVKISEEDRQYYSKLLETWVGLNGVIMTADEPTCHTLMAVELETKRRKQFVMRIHSRLNKLRADRERDELLSMLGSKHVQT